MGVLAVQLDADSASTLKSGRLERGTNTDERIQDALVGLREEANQPGNILEGERCRVLALDMRVLMCLAKAALNPDGDGFGNPFLGREVVESVDGLRSRAGRDLRLWMGHASALR